MFNLDDRDTQTRVKHEILEEYLVKWGSIITHGLKGHYIQNPQFRGKFKARFIYVDYFSFVGAYKENGAIVDGSPVIGIKALDKIKQYFSSQTAGLTPTTMAILFEEDKQNYQGLLANLKQLGYETRIKTHDDFASLEDGDIAIINDDSAKYVDKILKFIDLIDPDPTYSFHFIDPYGAKGVERTNIEKIVSKKRADCIINMMLNPISRFIGAASKVDANPTEQAYAIAFDKFYGSSVWRKIASEIENNTISREIANRQLVDAFIEILNGADAGLTVKEIALKFGGRDQTIYYLLLTTRDSDGAFEMNEILADARIREYDYRVEKRHMITQPGQLDFFGVLQDQHRPTEPEVDIDLLANEIYKICQKNTITYKDVKNRMAHTAYFKKDINDALTKLKAQKRANFDGGAGSLRNKAEIKFL